MLNRRQLGISLVVVIVVLVAIVLITRSDASSITKPTTTSRDLPANRTDNNNFIQRRQPTTNQQTNHHRHQHQQNIISSVSNNTNRTQNHHHQLEISCKELNCLIVSSKSTIEKPKLNQEKQQLHFGAKVSISVLIATILIVATATLVDLNQKQINDRRPYVNTSTANSTLSRQPSSTTKQQPNQLFYHQQFLTANQFQSNNQEQLRDQRSPSLSSTSSSSIFCSSANSVASACIPILGSWQHCNHTCQLDDGSLMRRGEIISNNYDQTSHRNESNFRWLNKNLIKQLFLAFSLRHSASLIFRQSEGNQSVKRTSVNQLNETICSDDQVVSSQTAATAQQVDGHRIRVSSLSSDSANQAPIPTNYDSTERNQPTSSSSSSSGYDESPISSEHKPSTVVPTRQQEETSENESIDSLHGLKFLSMIWIIVVHSYSLATRWSFFTDNSTPSNIYTSIASQLLSNGTFACDSFFFTGGFLLAYLAFPSSAFSTSSSLSSSPAEKTPAPQDEAASPASKPASVPAQSAHAEPQFQIPPQQQQQRKRNQKQKFSQTTTTSADNLTEKDCKVKDGGGKQADSCCNCEEKEGTKFNGFSSPSTNQCFCYFCSTCYKRVRTDSSAQPQACSPNTCLPVATSQLVLAVSPHQENMNNYERNLHQHQYQQQQQINFNTNNSSESGQITLNVMASHRNQNAELAVFNYSTLNDKRKDHLLNTNEFTLKRLICNLIHRYIRMMPLMMAIIGLSATLLRYLGDGPAWDNSTIMFDKWCRKNWWINSLFLHNFVNTENMCLSHSWYSAVDIQLYLIGQIILFVLYKNRKLGLLICCTFLIVAPAITAALTLLYNLPAVPLTISSISEQSLNIYYGEIYIKPYCRAAPYLIGILLAYLMRTTSLGQARLKKWQVITGWTLSLSVLLAILLAMQPAMNGQPPSELVSALYSALSRPLWACATGWMIFACITKHGGIFDKILSAKCFVPFSRLTYPAFLIHPIVMAIFYGSRPERSHFSHYLMLYLILGHILITYSCAFVLSALFELPLLSVERVIKRALSCK